MAVFVAYDIDIIIEFNYYNITHGVLCKYYDGITIKLTLVGSWSQRGDAGMQVIVGSAGHAAGLFQAFAFFRRRCGHHFKENDIAFQTGSVIVLPVGNRVSRSFGMCSQSEENGDQQNFENRFHAGAIGLIKNRYF